MEITFMNLFPKAIFFFFGSTTDVGQGLPVPTSELGFQ